jgi:hypothetical protein
LFNLIKDKNQASQFLKITGAGHNDIETSYQDEYVNGLSKFLEMAEKFNAELPKQPKLEEKSTSSSFSFKSLSKGS